MTTADRKKLREVQNALCPTILFSKMVEGRNCYYEVKLHSDGSTSCPCPSWRFQKGVAPKDRYCKHTLEVFGSAPPVSWNEKLRGPIFSA